MSRERGLRIRILQGMLPLDKSRVPAELIAGATLAAVAIPETMGYSTIAGMPIVTGLYTILLPLLLFAVLGSSRHLVVGADSASAAILAAGLVGIAQKESSQYVALAGLVALLTGAFLFIARLARLGFLADFLSRTVLVGFLTGVGIQVAFSQIPDLLGISPGGLRPLPNMLTDLEGIPDTNLPTLAVTAAGLLVILGGRRISNRFPGALVAVVAAIAASYLLDLKSLGVSVVGDIQGGLPPLGLPQVSLGDIPPLIPLALSISVIVLAQSAATSRAYALKYDEQVDENTDLVGLGMANVGAGLTGTFVVNGSPTKTEVVVGAGGRSQLSQVSTSLIVLLVLLFLTGPLALMPTAVLATVVFTIGIDLMDQNGMRSIYQQRRAEFWLAVITVLTVVFIGMEQGIVIAMILSVILHLRHSYRPKGLLLARDPKTGDIRAIPAETEEQALPGLIIYRFTASMYFANSQILSDEVRRLLRTTDPPLRWLCIDFAAVEDVDYSAAITMRNLLAEANEHGTRIVFAQVMDHVRSELDRSGITDLAGPDAYFDTTEGAIRAYQSANRAPDDST